MGCVCAHVSVCLWGPEETRLSRPLHRLGGDQLSGELVGMTLALPALAGQVALGERGSWPPPCDVGSLVSDVLSWSWNPAGSSADDPCVQGCVSVYGGGVSSTVLSEVQALLRFLPHGSDEAHEAAVKCFSLFSVTNPWAGGNGGKGLGNPSTTSVN